MEPKFTAIPNDLLEAVLKFKCPSGHKEVIFAVFRLLDGYHRTERAISISYLSKLLEIDKSNIAKKLKGLIVSNVLKETSSPNYTEARHIEINRNFKEWAPVPAKPKAKKVKLPSPTEVIPDRVALSTTEKSENTTVEDSATTPVVDSTTIKDTSSSLSHRNNIAVVTALKKEKDEKQQQPPGKTKSFSEEEMLDKELIQIFQDSLGRKPNRDEVCELRKQVLEDRSFTKEENMDFLKRAFHRAAISDERKRHTVYILGIIRSMKFDSQRYHFGT